MNVFKNADFHNWTERLGISDAVLSEAIKEISLGGYEANLGGNIY